MPRPTQDVTDAELAVLETLWSGPPSNIRALAERLYAGGGGATEYATVQKLLERLEKKGYVKRERNASPQQFSAAVRREDLLGRRLRTLAEKLCGGSLSPILTHLVSSEKLTPDEIASLRKLLDELSQRQGGKSKR